MKFNIAPLGQRDPRWSRKHLGDSTTTIGSYGCLLVCHAMMLNYYGKELDPIILNQIYKEKNVFDQGNLINFYAAADVYGDITADERYVCLDVPCDMSKVDKYLLEKKPVIAHVDNVNNDNRPDHFVLIIGKDEQGKYFINDPWEGETYYFHAKYGDPARNIYGLRLYSGTPKNGESWEDKVRDLQDSLKSANQMLAEKALEANNLRDALEKQETENKDLASQLNTARGEKDKISWAKTLLETQIKTLKEQVDGLISKVSDQKNTITELRDELKAFKNKSIEVLTKWELLRYTITKFLGR